MLAFDAVEPTHALVLPALLAELFGVSPKVGPLIDVSGLALGGRGGRGTSARRGLGAVGHVDLLGALRRELDSRCLPGPAARTLPWRRRGDAPERFPDDPPRCYGAPDRSADRGGARDASSLRHVAVERSARARAARRAGDPDPHELRLGG